MGTRRVKSLELNGIVVGRYLGSDDHEEDLQAGVQALRDLGLYREPSLLRAMRTQAQGFTSAANLAYKKAEARSPGNPPITFVPFVVNAAFAVELYLKTFLQATVGAVPRRVHALVKLHGLLNADVRQRLDAACVQHLQSYAPGTVGTFLERLAPISDAFVRWRYSYEHERLEAVRPRSVILVMAACHEVCGAVVPAD